MMIRRQDISVLLLYYLGYSKIRNWVFRFQKKQVARFLTIHDIFPEMLECFMANMHFLKRSTNVVSIEDYFAGRLSADKINVVITFDDGYKSWISDAIPILRKLKLPATFFVSSGFVGLSKEAEVEFMRSKLFSKYDPNCRITGCLSNEDVMKIVGEGFTIGGHTVNHSNLAKLQDEERIRREIAEDKIRLEKMTGKKIEYFAYPSGACHNRNINIIDILKESGFRGAVTTSSGYNSVGSNPYLLHRELTSASMPGSVFKARVYGNYDAVEYLKNKLRSIFLS